MSAPAWTPGPWHVEVNGRLAVTVFATRGGDDDKIVIGVATFGPFEGRWNDGRLIAAAPDLAEALAALQLQALQSPDLLKTEWGQQALELAGAALAKARGVAA